MNTLNKDLAAIQLNQVIEQLKSLADWQLVNIYTDYADENRYEDIHDLSQDTINDLFDSPWDAITKSNHSGFNENDSYFVFNGYGLMSSFTSLDSDNSPIDISELAQWLIDEDKLSEYDITVTTIGDMLASVEDNITDDENMLHSLMDYLNIGYDKDKVSLLGADYETSLIDETMDFISVYDYNQLNDIINYLGINYQ